MNSNRKKENRVTALLILLNFIPVVAGMVRLVNFTRGVEITAENSRFFASPTPVILHIISASIFCIIGALQFNSSFRKRNPIWHRYAGRVLILSGIFAALSGLWMTNFYPLHPTLQGNLLYSVRMTVGIAMLLFIILSSIAIWKRDIQKHQAWIIRGYAIGQGAGTQALILLPWTLIMGKPELFTYELLMGLGWIINSVAAEWIILKTTNKKTPVQQLQVA